MAIRNSRRVIMISSSLADGLRDSKIGEEIAELLVRQSVEKPLRHQAFPRRLDRLDLRGAQRDVLAVKAAQDRDLVVAIDEEPAQDPVVRRRDDVVLVALADLGARVHDAEGGSEEHTSELQYRG